ncbi:LuxR C-terminal-related transcriptional regulator [Photobacterium leiognathi]|uniref:LuxR C-terminal-related transcriptional regulator n=1 Tax=Photobacterium leiognathi TaxID=553611 RepID=UPI002980E220|nr:LuxR C-terminal-related transcriptional regulator [Photobacterium leiognathi]
MQFIGLSKLETRICHLCAIGKSDYEIAKELDISPFEVSVSHAVAIEKLMLITRKKETEINVIFKSTFALLLVMFSIFHNSFLFSEDDDYYRLNSGVRNASRVNRRNENFHYI